MTEGVKLLLLLILYLPFLKKKTQLIAGFMWNLPSGSEKVANTSLSLV